MSAHSPGPWRWDSSPNECDSPLVLYDAQGFVVLPLSPECRKLHGPDLELIARAPDLLRERDELLAALKRCLNAGPDGVELARRLDECAALVRRIEGK